MQKTGNGSGSCITRAERGLPDCPSQLSRVPGQDQEEQDGPELPQINPHSKEKITMLLHNGTSDYLGTTHGHIHFDQETATEKISVQ